MILKVWGNRTDHLRISLFPWAGTIEIPNDCWSQYPAKTLRLRSTIVLEKKNQCDGNGNAVPFQHLMWVAEFYSGTLLPGDMEALLPMSKVWWWVFSQNPLTVPFFQRSGWEDLPFTDYLITLFSLHIERKKYSSASLIQADKQTLDKSVGDKRQRK